LRTRQPLAGLARQPPQQCKFAQMQAEPAIIDASVAVEQVKRQVSRLAEAADRYVTFGEMA
jgi:hypothetical protein